MRNGLITVLKTVRFDCGSHGSLLFAHRTILEAKRTTKMNGSRFSRLDRTVRSGFQNLDFELNQTVGLRERYQSKFLRVLVQQPMSVML